MDIKNIDSLIFDMDGTLWDATDSYVEAWNRAIVDFGLKDVKINRKDLENLMGIEERVVYQTLFPYLSEAEQLNLAKKVSEVQDKCLPELGGVLYPGVKEGIDVLKSRFKLFVVSNCPEHTVSQFLHYTGLQQNFIDHETFGRTRKPKAENIKLIVERNNLKNPVYIGDTESDYQSSVKAGVPFMHVTYGFGKPMNHDFEFSTFDQLVEFFVK